MGDLLVRGGVHTPQTDAILDVQVIYLNAPSRVRRPQGKRGRGEGKWQLTIRRWKRMVRSRRRGLGLLEVEGRGGGGRELQNGAAAAH